MNLTLYFSIAQILISIALTVLILLQVRQGGLGVLGGAESAVYRTRRGIERTLFIITTGLSIAFFAITIVNAIIAG